MRFLSRSMKKVRFFFAVSKCERSPCPLSTNPPALHHQAPCKGGKVSRLNCKNYTCKNNLLPQQTRQSDLHEKSVDAPCRLKRSEKRKRHFSLQNGKLKTDRPWEQNNGTRYFCLSFFLLKVKKNHRNVTSCVHCIVDCTKNNIISMQYKVAQPHYSL
jgi:hypothetical protein